MSDMDLTSLITNHMGKEVYVNSMGKSLQDYS